MTEGNEKETVDLRLRRLAGATDELAPPKGLAERLADPYRAKRRRPSRLEGVVLPFGRPALFAATLAAAAAIALSVQVERDAEESFAEVAAGEWWEP